MASHVDEQAVNGGGALHFQRGGQHLSRLAAGLGSGLRTEAPQTKVRCSPIKAWVPVAHRKREV